MDRKRTRKWHERPLIRVGAGVVGVVVVLAGLFVSTTASSKRMLRGELIIDTVRHGDLTQVVRAQGKLVPKYATWVDAKADGFVTNLYYEPGDIVNADTVLARLSNENLRHKQMEADLVLEVEKAKVRTVAIGLNNDQLQIESNIEVLRIKLEIAESRLDAELGLESTSAIAALNLKKSKLAVKETKALLNIEERKLQNLNRSYTAQMSALETQIKIYEAIRDNYRAQVDGLVVRAGVGGVVQTVNVEIGEKIEKGTHVAKLVKEKPLIGILLVPEFQIQSLEIGQLVNINTRSGFIVGRVNRIDPVVIKGGIKVEVTLQDDFSGNYKQDLSIEGSVVVNEIRNTLFVKRSSMIKENSKSFVFRVNDAGSHAKKIEVMFGSSNSAFIEVLSGLEKGDRIIISDTSSLMSFDKVDIE